MSLHENTIKAMRLALGKHCITTWMRVTKGSADSLFESLSPDQLNLVNAWRTILEYDDETVGVDATDVYRGSVADSIERKVQIPAVLAGCMTFMSDHDWEFPRKMLAAYLDEKLDDEEAIENEKLRKRSEERTLTGMTIVEGDYYLNGTGHVRGPMRRLCNTYDEFHPEYVWTDSPEGEPAGNNVWTSDGFYIHDDPEPHHLDLVYKFF